MKSYLVHLITEFGRFPLKMKKTKKIALTAQIVQVVIQTVKIAYLVNRKNIVACIREIVSTALTLDKAVWEKIQMTYREMERKTSASRVGKGVFTIH